MTAGERGPMGDHGQDGRAGTDGAAGTEGTAGKAGERGAKGERGERGLNPWAVRSANLAYGLLTAGLFLSIGYSEHQDRQNDKRDAETDRALCALSRDSRTAINVDRDADRALVAAVRQSFELVQPAPAATPAERARILEFRRDILAQLDAVKINPNLELPNCSGIGNGNGGPSITPTTRSTP